MSDTPITDAVERHHALAWFGLRDELGRYQDGMARFRELSRKLEKALSDSYAFIDAHAADPDITERMRIAYAAMLKSRAEIKSK